jgi:hypothetical protein
MWERTVSRAVKVLIGCSFASGGCEIMALRIAAVI